MVTVTVEGLEVRIDLIGAHQWWALKKTVRFERARVLGVRRADKRLRPAPIKCPGTYLPGIFAAGSFYWKNRKEFWDTRFKGKAIEIDLSDEKYSKIVVDVRDPDSTIALLSGSS